MAMGVTTLPGNAAPEQERTFVLVWLGIASFILLCVIVLASWIVS